MPIDKASNNVAFVCKSYYVYRILSEIGIPGGNSDIYCLANKDIKEILENNIQICRNFGLELIENEKCLPLMYWMPKLHKTPIEARFIIASRKCSTKPLSKAVSKVFKLIQSQMENFHEKSKFYKRYRKFWVVQNSDPIIKKLFKINSKKKAKNISTFDFSTLYTTLPHADLVKVLSDIIDFASKGGRKTFISVNKFSAYWSNIPSGVIDFSKLFLKEVMKHLIEKCYFQVGNLCLLQTVGIPMGIVKESKFRKTRSSFNLRFKLTKDKNCEMVIF